MLQPVFFGFGWKGLDVAGPVVPPAEYARYCRYLVARYGAGPVVYLVGADGSGKEPQVPAGGEEIERWDCYGQPTGLHYRPHADNAQCQDADWLDFQWCQTGHTGEHVAERVADMWRNTPAKGVANGEPTYEGTRSPDMARGLVAGPRGLEQPVRRRHDGRRLRRRQPLAVGAATGRARPSRLLPGAGLQLARGARLPGLDVRRAGRPHSRRAADHRHGAGLARTSWRPDRSSSPAGSSSTTRRPGSRSCPCPTSRSRPATEWWTHATGAVVATGRVTEPVQPIYTPGDNPRVIIMFDEAVVGDHQT